MGNNQNGPTLEIQIKLDKESFSVDEQITGNLMVTGAQPSAYDFEIKIQGYEQGEFQETPRKHKYNVKQNTFYVQILNKSTCKSEGSKFFFQFHQISQPSLKIDTPELKCEIKYQIYATAVVTQTKAKCSSIFYDVEIYKPYKSQPYQKEQTKAYDQKTQHQIRRKQERLQIEANLTSNQQTYFSNNPIHFKCNVKTALYNNIIVKAYLCAEFYLQDLFVAAMPKVLLSEPQRYEINGKEQELEFKINQNLETIPPITLGEKIGCRHLVILQFLFEQKSIYNCDILFPLEIFQQRENNQIQYQRAYNEQSQRTPSSPELEQQQQQFLLKKKDRSSISRRQKEWNSIYPMFELDLREPKNMRIAQIDQFINIQK